MVIAQPTCERCGVASACTKLELYVLGRNVCETCRSDEECKAVATEEYLNAEYEVKRLLTNHHGIRPDGSPGPKLTQAMYQRDHHLARVIGGPVIPVLTPEAGSTRRFPVLRSARKLLWKLRRMVRI